MKGSESLWNEEELLTQMEQMQDQIEQLLRDKAELQETISAREELLSQQERQSSSEISKLQSALQQAQKKLQEQSVQIVRQSEADLILQDNERLKKENGKLRSENEGIRRETAREAEAVKAHYNEVERSLLRKERTLNSREEVLRKRKQELDDAFSQQDETIRKKVDREVLRLRQDSAAELMVEQRKLSTEFEVKEHKIRNRMRAVIFYSATVTILLVVRSSLLDYLKILTDGFAGWISVAWSMLNGFADGMALNSLRLPGRVPHQILYYAIRWGIIGTVIAVIPVAAVMIIYQVVKKRGKPRFF